MEPQHNSYISQTELPQPEETGTPGNAETPATRPEAHGTGVLREMDRNKKGTDGKAKPSRKLRATLQRIHSAGIGATIINLDIAGNFIRIPWQIITEDDLKDRKKHPRRVVSRDVSGRTGRSKDGV